MKKLSKNLIYLLGFISISSVVLNAQPQKINIQIGYAFGSIKSYSFQGSMDLMEAFDAIGGITYEKQYIVIIRNDKWYIIDKAAKKAGAFDLMLKNGDVVFFTDPTVSLSTLKSQHPDLIAGLAVLKALSATEKPAESTPTP